MVSGREDKTLNSKLPTLHSKPPKPSKPTFKHSNIQTFQHSNIPSFKHSLYIIHYTLYIIRKGLVPLDPLGVVGHSCHGVRAHTATGLHFGDDATEGVVSVGGREPFRVGHRCEAASTTLRILIASSES